MMLWARDLMDRYDLLSLRERVIVLVALVLLLMLLWDSLLMGPLEKDRKLRLAQVEALRSEVEGLDKSVEAIVAMGDPARQGRADVERLRKEITALDTQLAGVTSGLIAPKEMSQVLEQLLKRTSRMTLHALRTLPPESVVAPLAGDTASASAALDAGSGNIYRHGVELELDGSYLEALAFLRAVEGLPWRFFWDQVEYTVLEHPRGRMKLTLYTLGLQEGWIGV